MLRVSTEKYSKVPLMGVLTQLAVATKTLSGSGTTSSTHFLTAKVWTETKKVQ